MQLTVIRSKFDPNKTYEQFVEERKQGLGGSDIGDLVNAEPYGCNRRLVLDKVGLLPPRDFSHHLERGKFFEKPVAELYTVKTGRVTREVGTGYLKEYPYVRANADRLQYRPPTEDPQKRLGVLEIKCPSAWSFKKIKKEGLPEAYILQLQWQMLCYGVTWGSFAVYWPDGHELLWFDVERDDALCQMLFERARDEWLAIDATSKEAGAFMKADGTFDFDHPAAKEFLDSPTFPDRRPPEHTACQNCSAFDLCHSGKERGTEVVEAPELETSADNYAQAKAKVKEWEAVVDEIKSALQLELEAKKASLIKAGKYLISVRTQSRESISPKVKEVLTQEQSVLYVKRSEYDVLTVKEAKK